MTDGIPSNVPEKPASFGNAASHTTKKTTDSRKILSSWEATRRGKYQAKLDATRLHWQSHVDLIKEGHQEALQARRLVLGMVQTHIMLAATLQSQGRQTKVKENDDQSKKFKKPAKSTAPSLIDSLHDSTRRIQEDFRTSAHNFQDIELRILDLALSAQATQEELESKGKDLVECMERAEATILEAWDAYYGSSERSPPRRSSSSGGMRMVIDTSAAVARNSLLIPNINNNQSIVMEASRRDRWLAEVRYRSALQEQQQVWQLSLGELQECIKAAKHWECTRRINLREYLIEFLGNFKSSFAGAESAQSLALVDWIEKETTERDVQQQVETAIFQLKGNDGDPNASLDPDDERISIAGFYKDLFVSVSPLDSEHAHVAMLVEKRLLCALASNKSTTTSQRLQPASTGTLVLAVITGDFILHILDVPPNSCKLGDSAEMALNTILDAMSKKIIPSLAYPVHSYSLEPSLSADLADLSVLMSDVDDAVEVYPAKSSSAEGIAEQFGVSFAPVLLRTSSPRDQVTLINALHRQDTRVAL